MTIVGIGQPARRIEDGRLLMGEGRFVDDLVLPHQAHGAVLYSPHAHARIARIETAAAGELPGVLTVLTGRDAEAERLGGFRTAVPVAFRTEQPVLAKDRVRHVGDRVAFVVAKTMAAARDAAERIEVEYEPLPVVATIEAALADGAPALWPDVPDNIAFTMMAGDVGTADAAFARATHVVRLRLTNNRVSANPLEPRVTLGAWNAADRAYTLYTSTQHPHHTRGTLANDILHCPETSLRVVAGEVGGGFGMKAEVYAEEALVLWAARRVGRPVKWVGTRSEGLASDNHGRDQICDAEMALDAAGHILAVKTLAFHNIGAYIAPTGPVPLISMRLMVPSVYRVPVGHFVSKAVLTNRAPTGVYRGAGQPEAMYVMERLIDCAARDIDLDPVELRRRNFITAGALPFTTATGRIYDSGDFPAATERCLELADRRGFEARREASRSAGLLRGLGIGYYVEMNGPLNDRMEIRFDPSGGVTILAGTFSHGQGHETTYAQMVSDWLGVPFDSILFVQGDTARVAFGRGTYGARSGMVGGSALRLAAEAIIMKARSMASHMLEAAPDDLEFAAGCFTVVGTDRSVGLQDVARASFAPLGLPQGHALGLEAVGTYAPLYNFPNGCHACEVEIDPETGATRIVRYTVVDDVGRVINPMIVDGQIHGGIAQGIGQALMENVAYDPQSGQLLAGSFMDYAMPRAADLPSFATEHREIPCRTNPIGVKGAGEGGTVGAPPAVVNAILDALRPLGITAIDMPATPMRVWQTIAAARGRVG
jgi:aerobic carbon-monoxide dehydrogenase large subunit